MKTFKPAFLIFLVLVAISYGFYFRNDLFNRYQEISHNLESLKDADIGNVLSEVKKEILTPPPLNIGGLQDNQSTLTKARVIAETNVQRYNNGLLPPLSENQKLDEAAKAKAEDILAKQYFEHISPSGVGPGDLVKSYGYDFIVTGENLILGNFADEAEAVQDWMDSPGHRANILNERFTEIGVAFVKGTYEGRSVWVGVQEFGLPLSTCPQPETSLKSQIEANQSLLSQLSAELNSLKSQIESTNPRSNQYNNLVNEYNSLVAKYNNYNDQTKALIQEYNNEVNLFNQCVSG